MTECGLFLRFFSAYIIFYFFVDRYEKSKACNDKSYRKYFAIVPTLFFVYEKYINAVPENIFPYGTNRLPWHIEYIPFAFFYMFVGYLFRERWEETFDRFNSSRNRLLLAIVFLIVLYSPLVIGAKWAWQIEIVYTLIIKIMGLAVVISVCKQTTPPKVVLFIGQNTLIYFGLHSKVITLVEALLKSLSAVLIIMS